MRMVQADPARLSEGLEVKEAKLADKAYFSVKEFKDRLGVSSNLIYEQLREGALPSVRLGGRILIPADALQHLMESIGGASRKLQRRAINLTGVWYRELDNSISRWAPSVCAPNALPPTRYELASDAIIIASNSARCHSAAGLFVLITR